MQIYLQINNVKNYVKYLVITKKCSTFAPNFVTMAKKRRTETHTCAYCGKTFKARAGALYCSASCRNTAAKLKRELEQKKETPIKVENKPVESRTQPIGTISYTPRVLTREEARAELWSILCTAGILWAVDKVFSPKPKRTKRKSV